VANGDLSKKITVDVKGEILELKSTINTMVDQLNSSHLEVTRVAREVGTEENSVGQAEVKRRRRYVERSHRQRELHGWQPDDPGPQESRAWLLAVANGNLKRKLQVEARRNRRTRRHDQRDDRHAATFADQVTTVAREVGIEGKLAVRQACLAHRERGAI